MLGDWSVGCGKHWCGGEWGLEGGVGLLRVRFVSVFNVHEN